MNTKQINKKFEKILSEIKTDKRGEFAKFKKSEGYALLIEAGNTVETIQRYVAAKALHRLYPETVTIKEV